jgi:hypothetical protein
LADRDSTLDALQDAAKPRIGEHDHLVLNSEVDAALACVASIGSA